MKDVSKSIGDGGDLLAAEWLRLGALRCPKVHSALRCLIKPLLKTLNKTLIESPFHCVLKDTHTHTEHRIVLLKCHG